VFNVTADGHSQAAFLVTVMLHSGVCLGRQYCAYSRIVRGQKMYDFFASLVARRLATPYSSAHRRARIYHVHGKPLYALIGEPNNRNRKTGDARARHRAADDPRHRHRGAEAPVARQ
jgi:hypothetical protein